jgi:hypothetical protein
MTILKYALFTLVATLAAGAAETSAEPRLYGGGIAAVDAGSRGAFDTLGTTMPAAGGFIGLRFHDSWSIEWHADRAFAESAEREHLEIYGRSIVQDRAGGGFAVLAAWKVRRGRRVGAAVTMGVAVRTLRTYTLTINKIIPDDPYPARLGVSRTDAGVGLAGGILFPTDLGGRWSLAPELRVLPFGVTAESGGYAQVYAGVRLMWGF